MLVAIGAAALAACIRLPVDWRDAARTEAFEQSACTGDVAELSQRSGPRMTARAEKGRLLVDYLDAQFRCDQALAGYVKVRGEKVDVLVQPADMHPFTVAKCDCLYNVHLEVPGLAAGTYEVTLYRRWDDRHSPNDPVRVGSGRVTVR